MIFLECALIGLKIALMIPAVYLGANNFHNLILKGIFKNRFTFYHL